MTALLALASLLRCPHCAGTLASDGRTLGCASGHRFDIARQGYVSLGTGGKVRHPGDTAEMVQSRTAFLSRGHYGPIRDAVIASVPQGDGLCVDLAGGTGYYLAGVLDAHADLSGITIDSSVPAARTAGRAHVRAASIAADVSTTLPIADGAATHVLVIFGPRNGAEIHRVLGPEGILTVVTPRPDHLHELRDYYPILGIHPDKQLRVDASVEPLRRIATDEVTYRVSLSHEDAIDLVLMGPNGHHLTRDAVTAMAEAAPDPLDVTIAVTVAQYAR